MELRHTATNRETFAACPGEANASVTSLIRYTPGPQEGSVSTKLNTYPNVEVGSAPKNVDEFTERDPSTVLSNTVAMGRPDDEVDAVCVCVCESNMMLDALCVSDGERDCVVDCVED